LPVSKPVEEIVNPGITQVAPRVAASPKIYPWWTLRARLEGVVRQMRSDYAHGRFLATGNADEKRGVQKARSLSY
jgi:hypothetical protein